MAISLASLKCSTMLKPPRILIHGVAGVGKRPSPPPRPTR